MCCGVKKKKSLKWKKGRKKGRKSPWKKCTSTYPYSSRENFTRYTVVLCVPVHYFLLLSWNDLLFVECAPFVFFFFSAPVAAVSPVYRYPPPPPLLRSWEPAIYSIYRMYLPFFFLTATITEVHVRLILTIDRPRVHYCAALVVLVVIPSKR